MKIILLYLRVLGKSDSSAPEPSYYKPYSDRFRKTYIEFRPTIEHELIAVNCGTAEKPDSEFDDIASSQMFYTGPAWDIGAYQNLTPQLDCDLVVCMATPVHFWKHGWLERLAQAATKHGLGVYAPMASYETAPHLRTGCFSFHPKLMRDYPVRIDTRDKCCTFESRPGNFSLWAIQNGYPAMMVTENACYEKPHWRMPPNIFRRGDQSNCMIWDRHNDIWFNSSPEDKLRLSNSADGL